ncbi:uncharacterized protein LOC113513400 [Galleria mellonella]|uniref:Uncharacterized protein LOC113513400 n=1 Tax=Galleria mellonella TaxID=7137 RepID=A0A6J1WGK8_GALME|nr:uncharacterized protein LOC113513400 [Galleria mellonella]
MAVTRRGYIFSAFLLSVLSILLIIVAIASDSWIVSRASEVGQELDSHLRYGLFTGLWQDYTLITPVMSTLHMTCVPGKNACAQSCKTTREARLTEVEALADGYRPMVTCTSVTLVNTEDPLPTPPVISFVFYLFLLLVVILQMLFAIFSAGLAIINSIKNPTEPVFSLLGCLWFNLVTVGLGIVALMMFGIYWATSGLQEHLAFSFIALGSYRLSPSLGYSYWLLIVAVVASLLNIGLLLLREYMLERDPPPPTLKIENHSDGTIFLY